MTTKTMEKVLPRAVVAGALWCVCWLVAVWCSWMPGAWDWAWGMALPALAGLLCGWILAGPKWGWAWLASLPAGFFLWALSLWDGVLTQMLNWASPGYGRMSAGGGFGVMVVTVAYSIVAGAVGPVTAWMVSWLRSLAVRKERSRRNMYDLNGPKTTGGLPGPAVPAVKPPARRIYEADLRERTLLFLTLGLGVLCADLMLAMGRHYLGLGITLLVLAWEAVLFWYAGDSRSGAGEKRCSLLLTAAVVLLALTFALYSDRWLWSFNILALPALIGVQMLERFGPAKRPWRDPVMLLERLWLVLEGLFGRLGAPLRAAASFGRAGTKKRAAYVALGLVLVLPVLMLVVPLLASADAVFSRLAGNAVDFLVDHFGALLVRLLLGLCAAPFLFSLLYFLRRPDPEKQSVWAKEMPVKGVDPALSVTVLAVLDGVYLLFVAVQSAALFGGEAYLAGTGMSYAEYARSGFFQLVWVACIDLAVVVSAVHFSWREGKLWQVLRLLSTGMVALSGVMLVSAAWRMTLYVGSYGLSFKRFLTYWGMVMLAVFFAAALMKIWKKAFGFFRVFFAASVAGWLILNFINVDVLVARYNVDAYLSGNSAVMDLPYLAGLSYGTLAQLEWLDGNMRVFDEAYWPDMDQYVLDTLLADRRSGAAEETASWETWNLSAWLAAQGR